MKELLPFILLTLPLLGEGNIASLQYKGVKVEITDENGTNKTYTIEREIDPKCLYVAIEDDTIWKNKYASSEVPKECKAEFVTSVGQIQPIHINDEVETYGELEVLNFIEQTQCQPNLLLIDSRKEGSYRHKTIPGAINIPFEHISKPNSFPDEYLRELKLLGVKISDKTYDFSGAKIVVIFCNGSWCAQSPNMIKSLLEIGYPPQKIKWYRGGMQDWLAVGFSTVEHRKPPQ